MQQILSADLLCGKGVIHTDLNPKHFLLDSVTANLRLFEVTTIALLEPDRMLMEPTATQYHEEFPSSCLS